MNSHVIELGVGLALMGYSIAAANAVDDQTPAWRRLATPVLGLGSVWLVLNMLVTSMPVLQDVRVRVVGAEAGRLLLAVHATKPAAARDCRWIGTNANVWGPSGLQHEAALSYPDDPVPGDTRPPGALDMGQWRLSFDQSIQPAGVTFEARHSCGWMWRDTYTRFSVDLRQPAGSWEAAR